MPDDRGTDRARAIWWSWRELWWSSSWQASVLPAAPVVPVVLLLGALYSLQSCYEVARAAFRFLRPLLFEVLHEVLSALCWRVAVNCCLIVDFNALRQRLLLPAVKQSFSTWKTIISRTESSPGPLQPPASLVAKMLRSSACLLLALHHAREQAAVGLARRIDRAALCDARKALAGFDFLLCSTFRRFLSWSARSVGCAFPACRSGAVFVVILFDLRPG